MAKQSFSVGQVLTASQMLSLQQTAMGGGSAIAKTANYVLVAADAGATVAMNAAGATTITVNTGLFAAGDTVLIQNLGAGTCTITAGTATVNTAGSLALVQYESGILYFTATGAAIFNDYVQAGGGGGGGKVLQVINLTTTTGTGASTSTFVDTAITATITPTLNTSKVLIFADIDLQKDNNNASIGTRLLRASTVIATMMTQGGYTGNSDFNNIGTSGITYLDEPATTSATTYKLQVNSATGNSVAVNAGGGRSSITLMEIGA
jgi:hypothetical protein